MTSCRRASSEPKFTGLDMVLAVDVEGQVVRSHSMSPPRTHPHNPDSATDSPITLTVLPPSPPTRVLSPAYRYISPELLHPFYPYHRKHNHTRHSSPLSSLPPPLLSSSSSSRPSSTSLSTITAEPFAEQREEPEDSEERPKPQFASSASTALHQLKSAQGNKGCVMRLLGTKLCTLFLATFSMLPGVVSHNL
ncbi:hypothetical protein AX16_004853 [Volvariella volvacea WC 439]|nr:hypothetical protein AX16_004853 [Volvariella volvacea WC 439]